MNEQELKTYCLEHAGETLTAEAEALIQRDPELKRQIDQLILVRKLISLKQYEQPHASCTERCVRAVTARIEEHNNRGVLVKLRDWFVIEQPAVGLAYAAAALAVCIAGASLYVSGNTDQAVIAAQEAPALEPTVSTKPEIAATAAVIDNPVEVAVVENPATEEVEANFISRIDKPLIILQVSSNPQPSHPRMMIGNGATVPVSFDY